MKGVVISVARRGSHRISKDVVDSIRLIAGEGVEGDAHRGVTVKHRSRAARDPMQPNLRQVHVIHVELHEELTGRGFAIGPARMGENILTRGVDLLGLPKGAKLLIGETVIEITGLRNPCTQLEGLASGLMEACLDKTANGSLIRKAGVMGIVVSGGEVAAGDIISVELPDGPHAPLQPV
jgi:MOSC domain-containing protein YiiM